MAGLDDEVRPLFMPMISGYSTQLTVDHQITIATWAAMKAAIFEYIWPHNPVLTTADHETIVRRGQLPAGCHVRLACVERPADSPRAYGLIYDLCGRRDKAICLAIGIGRLVVEVFSGPGADRHALKTGGKPGVNGSASSPRGLAQWPLLKPAGRP